jgi:hypothetical protein
MKNVLKNNSTEMKTVVETFVIEETAELIYDNEKLDEWNNLVTELGLTGQQSIVKKDKSPIPFMHLKSNLVLVFETLCPRKVDVSEYNKTPIPVEILSLVSLAKNEKHFDKIQIWYDEKSPDPVCIGLNFQSESDRKSNYTWRMDAYLLGKWADVKHSFAELVVLARKRWTEQETNRLTQSIKTQTRELEDIETRAFDMFGSKVNGNDSLPF